MSPDWDELARRAVAGAPPIPAEVLAELRELLPPATPVARTDHTTRQEVAA